MSTSTKASIALVIFGLASFFMPGFSQAGETAKGAAATAKFSGNVVSVPFEAKAANMSADQAEKAPAEEASQGGVLYRRLYGGNFMASHYDGKGKLLRRDIYRQPNVLVVIVFDANGKAAYRQTFVVTLDVYLREGKFGYQHEWLFQLAKLEVFQADGIKHAKVVVFYPNGAPRTARDVNVRGGLDAIRQYRPDGTLMTQQLYKGGRIVKTTRHKPEENLKETLDPAHTAAPKGTILINSEADDETPAPVPKE